MIYTDNTLIRIFLPIIKNGLLSNGFTNVTVQQSYQPTQQGIPTGPTVYFYKLKSKRYGFLGRSDAWDGVGLKMDHTETQYYETTFRVHALVLQNVHTPSYTASDLIEEVSSIMQSDRTLQILNTNEIGILRVTELGINYFVDDKDNHEAIPFFEFTLLYCNVRSSTNPIIDEFESGIYPV